MKTVIEMAREAGLTSVDKKSQYLRDCLERLVELARADEREACAKVCDELIAPDVYSDTDVSMWDVTCIDCAAAIRARSNT